MRKRRLIKSIIMIAALTLCCTGCEKKADVIEGYVETSEDSGSDTAGVSKTGDSKADSSKKETSETDNETSATETWNESIEGGDKGFGTVDIAVSFNDYSAKELSTTTVKFNEFNADFAKNMCDTVFDGGEAQVYDYSHKTKRVYDDLLKAYEDSLTVYDESEKIAELQGSALVSMPVQEVMFGYWDRQLISGELVDMDKSEIEEDIERLKKEKESAPETIENDYSYGGYLGKISGEEYYMYFGNRNFDEYLNSMDTTQFNGRVVTIMKSDLENAYAGPEVESVLNANSIIPGYQTNDRINIDSVDLSDDMMAAAKEFLGRIGCGDYVYNPEESGKLYWGNETGDGFIFANGYCLRDIMPEVSDGARLRFAINTPDMEKLSLYDIEMPLYSASGDTLDYDSYVDVLVNSNGVLGCQIYNPTTILKKDAVDSILDIDTLKDIVRESVKDKSLWNVCAGRTVNNFELSQVKLINFPVRSDSNKEEYTLVPSYIIDGNVLPANQITNPTIIPNIQGMDLPFLIVNAIDGSIIKVEDELTDYPAGWNNGNVGYASYKEYQWNRNQYPEKLMGQKDPEADSETMKVPDTTEE